MSEPAWSLPMNRAELIARCDSLAADLAAAKQLIFLMDGELSQAADEAADKANRIRTLDAELADWKRMRNEAMAVASSNRTRIDALEAALTPTAETKAAYHGEFHFDIICYDELGREYQRNCMVPWTTVKEIMAAIRAYSAPETPEKLLCDCPDGACRPTGTHNFRCRRYYQLKIKGVE